MNGEGFTSEIRQELASLPVPSAREARAELVGMLLHLGITSGVLAGASGEARAGDLPLAQHCHEGELRIEVPSSSVGRRAFALLQRAFDVRPSLTAVSVSHRRPSGPAYRVAVPASVVRARDRVRSQAQQPEGIEQDGADRDPETVALLRGVLLIGGSFSAPDRPAHLELSGVADDAVPLLLAALLQVLPELHAVHDAKRRRLVIKSGDAIADRLVALGATRAFLHLDDRRLRRQLRADANRLANADAANLQRVARRAGSQIDAIEAAVAGSGWDVFDEELRAVALARIANPSASISELGQLLDLPRTTLHRRLQRVEEAALGALARL